MNNRIDTNDKLYIIDLGQIQVAESVITNNRRYSRWCLP